MNKLKNNIIRSIPNLNQEGSGKILSTFKQNEMSGNKTTKHLEIDLKHKINSSIRENIASLSSDRLQPKKSNKLDEKVETIVDMIKQDLLPMLEIQNKKIERLERRCHSRKESASEKDLRESLLQELKINQTVENDVQNLSVSVDEIKKNLTNLDNLVKYQYLKRKNKPTETEDINYKSQINQLQIRLNTEIIEQKMKQQKTTLEMQEYMTIQLQEIKDWINNFILDKQKESIDKINQLENQIYQYLQQPFEVLRQLSQSYYDLQTKIQSQTLINSQTNINIESKQCLICTNTTQQNKITLNCGHQFHEDCLFTQFGQQLQNNEKLNCVDCKCEIKLNQIRKQIPNSQLLDTIFKQQLRKLIQIAQIPFGYCKKCGYIYKNNDENKENIDKCQNCI